MRTISTSGFSEAMAALEKETSVAALFGWVAPLLLAVALVGQGSAPPVAVPALLTVTAGALVAFVLIQRRAVEPLLNLSLFTNRRISLASACIFLMGISVYGVGVYLTPFLQGVLGASAARSGVIFGQYVLATMAGNVRGSSGVPLFGVRRQAPVKAQLGSRVDLIC